MRGAIVSDARFLAELEGRRHALLRMRGPVLQECMGVQERMQNALRGLDIVYPAPHLTWATHTPRIDVSVWLPHVSLAYCHRLGSARIASDGGSVDVHKCI